MHRTTRLGPCLPASPVGFVANRSNFSEQNPKSPPSLVPRTSYLESNGNICAITAVMIGITAEASPVGSEVFSLISLLVISLGVLLLLRHYLPLRTTPAYLLVPIFFALGIPASIILLVPIDLASNAREEDEATRGIWLPDRVLLVSWRICYWLTFVLTW